MKNAKILVVEDEKVVAADIEESLRKLGYTVIGAAASGVGAIRKAVETAPDLVLMDIKLKGGMDGVDAAGELHSRLGIPVVFLTAYADGEILERAKRSSPSGYVLKPFDERALRSAVEIALHRFPQERRLAESEGRLVSAIRSIDEGVIMTGRDGHITLLNRAAEKLTGWKQSEATGKASHEVFTTVNGITGSLMPDPVARVIRDGVGVGLAGNRVLVSRHGSETWIRGSTSPLHDSDGDLVGVAVIFRRADSVVSGETPATTSCGVSRFETLGRLTGGVSQEMRKSLDVVVNAVARLLQEEAEKENPSPKIQRLADEAERAARLAEKISVFTQDRVARPQAFALNTIVRDMEPLLECLVGESVELKLQLSPLTGRIVAAPGQVEEILLGLAETARHSMPEGGKITVETCDIEILGEYARAYLRLEPGEYAVLSVSHTGDGGPTNRQELEQASQYACETITAVGGDVRVQTEPGCLTTFEVYLPRAA